MVTRGAALLKQEQSRIDPGGCCAKSPSHSQVQGRAVAASQECGQVRSGQFDRGPSDAHTPLCHGSCFAPNLVHKNPAHVFSLRPDDARRRRALGSEAVPL